jgi:hypothetical protein
MDNSPTPKQLDQNSADYIATSLRAALGAVPLAGSLLTELATAIIPNQRVDRIVNFARELEHRIASLDEMAVRAKLSDENFTDLLEETALHAARSVTQERREYLASLLATGLTDGHISFIESKHLLRVLGEINDIEVVWLRFFLHPEISGDVEFRKKHAAVIEPIRVHLGSGQESIDRDALRKNYLQHLSALGLLEQPLHHDSARQPTIDPFTRTWKRQGHRLTPLGRLLLRKIGLGELQE